MKNPAPVLLAPLLLALVAVSTAPLASATFKPPKDVPVERLAANVAKYVEAHPDDAEGWYVLGRVHSLALVLATHTLGTYGEDSAEQLPFVDHHLHRRKDVDPPTQEEFRAHLSKAVSAFERSLALAPRTARTWLGLAYTMEAGAGVAADAPPGTETGSPTADDLRRMRALVAKLGADTAAERDAAEQALAAEGGRAVTVLRACRDDADPERRLRVRALLGRFWREAAVERYRRAFDLSIDEDEARPHLPIQGIEALVAHEAGSSWLRLVKERGPRPGEEQDVERVRKAVEALARKPIGRITPIVFSLDGPRPLSSLLAPDHVVSFDLDGDLEVERRTWVRPDTGILVWDPRGTGRITSGRQLFGTATWWMLWQDGYRAMDALDDDRDGVLEGEELDGLAVWRDANGNALSEAGEVVAVVRLGVVSLATRALHEGPNGPSHPRGIRFADGRTLPTYDWVADAVRTPAR